MTTYFYQATDPAGEIIEGDIEASDYRVAVQKVRNLNIGRLSQELVNAANLYYAVIQHNSDLISDDHCLGGIMRDMQNRNIRLTIDPAKHGSQTTSHVSIQGR